MMKRILWTLCFVTAFISGHADSYLTMGVNDTLLVYPNLMANNITFPVKASFTGYVDEWGVIFSYPSDMLARVVSTGADMSIPYIDITGTPDTLVAPLTVNWLNTEVSSKIMTFGYWDIDNDGNLEPYGTVKWDMGDYDDMFDITFQFNPGFTGGTLTMSGSIKSGIDYRQYVIDPNPTAFSRTITVIVGYRKGDVNGDGAVDVADVTLMIAYTLETITFDQYQTEAGDFNGDGKIDVSDVTILIGIVNSMTSGTLDIGDFFDS